MARFNFVLEETRTLGIGVEADSLEEAKKIAENYYQTKGFVKTEYQEHELSELNANPAESAEVDVTLNQLGLVTDEVKTQLEEKLEKAENILGYHNKNLTKAQEEAFQDLIDAIRAF